MAKLGDLIVNIGANTKSLDKSLGRVRRNMRNFGRNFKALGSDLTRSVTLPLAAIGAAAIKSASDLETLEVSFISLTGGADQAAKMMQQLNQFTAQTPFQIDAVATAARQLIASGTDISQVNEQLQFLGDIAATSGAGIDEIAAIFAKVNAKGKVELENLNQLAERGIPIFKTLSEATGLLPSELGAGAVTVEQFNEALKSFATEGGFAEGAMNRLSQTTAGKLSTALDNLKLAGASLVESIMPHIKSLIDFITNLAKAFVKLDPTIKTITLAIIGLTAAIGPLMVILPTFGAAIGSAFTLATGPLAPFIAALGAIVAGMAAIVAAAFIMFDDIAPPLVRLVNLYIKWQNESAGIRKITALLTNSIRVNFMQVTHQVELALAVLETLFVTLDVFATKGAGEAFKAMQQGMARQNAIFAKNSAEFGDLIEEIFQNAEDAPPLEFITVDELIDQKNRILDLLDFTTWFEGFESGAADATDSVNDLLDRLNKVTEKIQEATVKYVEMNNAQGEAFKIPEESGALLGFLNEFDMGLETTKENVETLGSTFNGLGQQVGSMFVDAVVEAHNFADTMKAVIKTVIKALLNQAIGNVIANASSSTNPANQASAGLTIPLFIGAGLAAVMGAFNNMPALAQGGLAFGPTTALIGDNRNAAIDPEVVAPLSKLRDIMGGSGTQVYGRISGDDILISNSRAMRDRNRM
jgi:tape measure domain-containing protein